MRGAFPGDIIYFPTGSVVNLGTGVTQTTNGVVASAPGEIEVNNTPQGKTVQVLGHSKRYVPQIEDCVIGTILEKYADSYRLDIGIHIPATLPALAFCKATKNNKPSLNVGDVIYCRVVSANKFMEPEVSCYSPHCTRDWVTGECLLSHLKDGYVFKTPIELARALRKQDNYVLSLIGGLIGFEICIGVNGYVYVKSETYAATLAIANVIQKSLTCSDEELRKIFLKSLKDLQQSD